MKNMNQNDKTRLWTLIDKYMDERAYYDSRIKVLLKELGDEEV